MVQGGGDFDIEPGRRPPKAESRPRVPTISASGEYISIYVSGSFEVVPFSGLGLGISRGRVPRRR
jgi:hypothetical protein